MASPHALAAPAGRPGAAGVGESRRSHGPGWRRRRDGRWGAAAERAHLPAPLVTPGHGPGSRHGTARHRAHTDRHSGTYTAGGTAAAAAAAGGGLSRLARGDPQTNVRHIL